MMRCCMPKAASYLCYVFGEANKINQLRKVALAPTFGKCFQRKKYIEVDVGTQALQISGG